MLTPLPAQALHILRMGLVVLCAAWCTWAVPSWAQNSAPELAVPPQTVQVGSQHLQRNGAGIRYKAIFKVYSAALYLEQPATSLEAIGQLTGSKRMAVSMLRTINAAELGKLFAHGMEDNMDKQQFSKLIPGVLRMSEVFNRHKELKTGDTFTLDWIPGPMLGIWLGPKPVDTQLKQALLAGTAE